MVIVWAGGRDSRGMSKRCRYEWELKITRVDSFMELEAIRISAIVCPGCAGDGCGSSSGQQASGHFGELELAEGAFATRGRAP